jgi:hypothetical protein
MPHAHDLFESALDKVFAGSASDNTVRIVAQNSAMLSREETVRLLNRLSDERILNFFLQSRPLKLDVDGWRAFFALFQSTEEKLRTGAIRLLGNYLNFDRPGDFFGDDAVVPEISKLLSECSVSEHDPVKSFCSSKVAELGEFLRKNLTSLNLQYVLNWIGSDIRASIKDPLLGARYKEHPSYMLLHDLSVGANSKWTLADFQRIWLPFFVDLFRAGNATEIGNTWTYLAFFHLAGAPRNSFWHLEKGDGVVEVLKERFFGGNNSAARMSGRILSILALVDSSPAGVDFRRSWLTLLDDSRPYVVSEVLANATLFEPYEPILLEKALAYRKSSDPELRGAAFGTLALLFGEKHIGRDVYVPLLPEIARALTSDNLTERTIASYSGWLHKEFADVRAALFPPAMITQLLAQFRAEEKRFIAGDDEAAGYFLGFLGSLTATNPKDQDSVISSEKFPLDVVLSALDSSNIQISTRAVRTTSSQQGYICGTHCGVAFSGNSELGDIKVTKAVLDRFAAVFPRSPDLEWQINASIGSRFSIRDYASGKIQVKWSQ